MKTRAYIPVRPSQVRYYRRVPLFFESAPGVFQLYKPAGMTISEVRLEEGLHPKLFIEETDRDEAALEVTAASTGTSPATSARATWPG